MPAEYSFEKRSIILLIVSITFLFALIFFLGLLIGSSMERSDPDSKQKLEAVAVDDKTSERTAREQSDLKSENSELAKETEPKPASPEFKEVSPKSEMPTISQPKKE